MEFIELNDLLNQLYDYDYKFLQVHHTWRPDHADFTGNNHIALQKGMRDYHVDTNGWADIGQHISIFPDGKIVTGRDFGKDPVGISNKNKGAFMFEMIGNFDKGHDVLKGKQLKTALHIVNYFIINNKPVVFHREYSTKSCPGTGIDKDKFMTLAANIYNISDWALDSVRKAMYKEVTDGSNPNQFMTLERYLTIADRLGQLD